MTDAIQTENLVESSLRESWALFKDDLVLYLVATLLVFVISAVTLGICAGPMIVGFIQLVRKRMRSQEGTATDVFDGFSEFGASLIAMILIGFGVFIGSMLLVLPGLIFGFITAFTFHAIALDGLGATSAIGQSYALIKENLAPSFALLLIVAVLNAIGGSIIFGSLLATPFSLIVMTIAYQRLRGATHADSI
ncbi:MAG: hypothetical protein HKN97_17195 [Myxococcales bacterium]|nr:hypothetical protein [Deltaproteobacteria bacterium]NND30325.1 hypothetical protein [Myxococcales bacterium]MBT8482184.1 hypothetical protein [Deltaproteobacteria bacterium]NNK43089.1 hypothetical protein [Myxococcales bacterium]NNL25045.1 hypothetical protein [Myxococcales bacterium]